MVRTSLLLSLLLISPIGLHALPDVYGSPQEWATSPQTYNQETLDAMRIVTELQAMVNERYPQVSIEAKNLQCIDCLEEVNRIVYHTDWLVDFFNDERNLSRLDEFFAKGGKFTDIVTPLNQHDEVPHGGARNQAEVQGLLAATRSAAAERTRAQGTSRTVADTALKVAAVGLALGVGAEGFRRAWNWAGHN